MQCHNNALIIRMIALLQANIFAESLTCDALLCTQIKKPLIERRRRERINDSLNQLKNLVLEATNKDVRRRLLFTYN